MIVFTSWILSHTPSQVFHAWGPLWFRLFHWHHFWCGAEPQDCGLRRSRSGGFPSSVKSFLLGAFMWCFIPISPASCETIMEYLPLCALWVCVCVTQDITKQLRSYQMSHPSHQHIDGFLLSNIRRSPRRVTLAEGKDKKGERAYIFTDGEAVCLQLSVELRHGPVGSQPGRHGHCSGQHETWQEDGSPRPVGNGLGLGLGVSQVSGT